MPSVKKQGMDVSCWLRLLDHLSPLPSLYFDAQLVAQRRKMEAWTVNHRQLSYRRKVKPSQAKPQHNTSLLQDLQPSATPRVQDNT
ncbi:uncharacterized protein LOC123509208 isoform X2 [Portunus trituberculatus]|uniref:uncharacterized protein LOC123509208 isoform X2 n=1 Tax=Portunus trituberculatus TaxID=210409 RepID=UPI001E1D1332|nr:uncharacterized protein LOC123509208 isoform X2 [Portunus trituberculatus]